MTETRSLEQALAEHQVVDDALNTLTTEHNIPWRQVAVFRAYAHYLAQLGLRYTPEQLSAWLTEYLELTELFVELFETGFDPELHHDAEERRVAREQIAAKITEAIESLQGEPQRFFSALLEVQLATVRTNFYRDRPTLAFKLRPTEISLAPQPRPMWEIWVDSPEVQGTHLRFSMVSRGGLRWSDRAEDFRTEVLGLVKAQRVKNSVIIPNGSKGGFVPQNLPDRDADAQAYADAGLAAYKLFIGSLLDVTDNLVRTGGEERIVTPENVVALDGPDHYLVVAADKGTATFSDTANAISTERGFWLGDAFASGGSVGFDHKEMGITARGAWESVKRHFASLEHDSQTEEFTMVGIGGMAGDVFGNGALLSPAIRLVAAFDSRHIFIDPTPDAASSLAERRRLFDLPRAYWTDYDPSLISTGGGIFSRRDETIELNDQIRSALGIEGGTASMTPAELIRAIVAAPVDLLYTGGTGTYVRASAETDEDVADHTNDAMRITAQELRARIVSEGGNLGLTQRARIEAARRGVLLNTDAVDNSAGVETSDHEVNLKILIDRLIDAGEISTDDRAAMIEAQVDEVGQQVLQSNIHQNMLLQAERMTGRTDAAEAEQLIEFLAEHAGLDRDVEFLPTAEELAQRTDGPALTAPELAVLAAYVKLWLTQELIDADSFDERFDVVLREYFPSAIAEKFEGYFAQHPLRREILATRVANTVVDLAGITFVHRMMTSRQVLALAVVSAFWDSYREDGLREEFEEIAQLSPTTSVDEWLQRITDVQRRAEQGTGRRL